MVNNINLQQELDKNKISYEKVGDTFVVEQDGSNFILEILPMPAHIGDEKEDLLSIFFEEKEPSKRTLEISFIIEDKRTYDLSMQFLFALLEMPVDGEIPFENEELREKIQKTMTHFHLTCSSFSIEGVNPAIQDVDLDEDDDESGEMTYHEKPLTKQEINDLKWQAVDKGDKEAYQKYQDMLDNLKESNSFKYLKNFRDFLD